jgi:CheY-like chemotaxis protein
MPELVKSTGNLSLEEPVTPADSIASDNFQLGSSEGDDLGSTSKSIRMPAASTVDAKPAKHGYAGSLKVLIVEDNLVNRNLLVQAVKATGVPHMEALDGGAAVEVFQKWQPTHGRLSSFGEWVERYTDADGACGYITTAVLLDIGLPVKSGFEVAQEIRQFEQ